MIRARWLSTFLLVVVAAAVTRADGPEFDPPLPDVVAVRLAPNWDIQSFLQRLDKLIPGVTVMDAIESRKIYLLDLPPGADEDAVDVLLDDNFSQDPNNPDPNLPLLWGNRSYLTQAAESRTGSVYVSFTAPTAPQIFRQQYANDMLGLDLAHNTSTGSGVTVAVIDTGVDAVHPELVGRVLPGFNFLHGTVDTSDVGDGMDNDADGQIDEAVGHGTFMAGLIALTAPDANILPIVALDSDGNGGDFVIAQAMFYAIDHGVEVINMSLGTTYESQAIEDAIEEADSLGIFVVGAAGNQGQDDPNHEEIPATDNDAFGVAAVNDADVRAPFSNISDELDLSAPGTSVQLDANTFDPERSILGPVPGGGYAWWEGTSASTAFVSGTVALIRAQHPEWWYSPCDGDPEPGESIPSRITRCLRDVLTDPSNVVDISAQNPAGGLGAGRLSTSAAVAAGPPAPTPGDLNNDGAVALADLAIMLADYGQVHSPADLNGNGRVELSDLALLLSNFGT